MSQDRTQKQLQGQMNTIVEKPGGISITLESQPSSVTELQDTEVAEPLPSSYMRHSSEDVLVALSEPRRAPGVTSAIDE